MPSSKRNTNRFLVMWDMLGLEYLVNLTALEKKKIFSMLKEENPPALPNLSAITMRARANPQRHYEIYLFDSEIDEAEIRDCFEHSPQVIVDAIREVGQSLYDNRASKQPAPVII